MQLNAYLFKPEVKKIEQAFREGQLPPGGGYQEVPLKKPVPFTGRAFLQRNKQSSPPWLDFFRAHCEFENPDEILNQSNSFVLALQVDGRVFALTHGQGYLALNRAAAEPAFGLTVAINALDPAKIRSTESRNLRETATLKQLVLSRPSSLDQFEVNFNRELLHRLEGGLARPKVGKRIRGSSSCAVVTTTGFEELETWCRRLLAIEAEAPPKEMKRTQRLRRVEEPKLIETLEGLLDKALCSGKAETLHLSPTSIAEYNQVDSYELLVGDEAPVPLDELDIQLVLPRTKKIKLKDMAATTIRLRGLDREGDDVVNYPLRDAVVFETSYKDDRYIRQPKGWVKVNPSLVDWVNQQLGFLGSPPRDYDLPDWKPTDNEGAYNKGIGEDRPDFYFTLDKKLVTVEGRSRIEVCDLLNRSGDLIHVKEYTSSSQAITHLVAQAQGSTSLLLNDRDYREKIRKQLPAKWKGLIAVDRISPLSNRIVLGIGAPPTRDIPGSLPFLSKQALVAALESMRMMGFQSFVCPIAKPAK